jgi:integrase
MSSNTSPTTLSKAEILRKWGMPFTSSAASTASLLRRFEEWCAAGGYPCPGTIPIVDEFLAGMPELAGTTRSAYRRVLFRAHGFVMPKEASPRSGPQMTVFMDGLPETVRALAEQEAKRLLSGQDILQHHMQQGGALFLEAPQENLPALPSEDHRSNVVLQSLQKRLEETVGDMEVNTKRSYFGELRLYIAWCIMLGRVYWPIEKATANHYIVWRLGEAEKAGSQSLSNRLNQIRSALHYPCSQRGLPLPWPPKDPIFAAMMKAAKEKSRPPKKARVLSGGEFAAICALLDDLGTMAAIRDKAMILLGRAGALRVSELTSRQKYEKVNDPCWDLRIEQLEFGDHGLKIHIGKSKTSDACESSAVPIAWGASPETCPVLAIQAWIDTMALQGRTTGPLFPALRTCGPRLEGRSRLQARSIGPTTFGLLLKSHALQVGIKDNVSTHSLRRSHVHTALKNKANPIAVQQQGRWKSLEMVAEYAAGLQSETDNSSMYLD